MGLLRTIRYRIRALARRTRLDREADEEMRFHLEMLAKEHEASGMSAEEARRRARIEFGGLEGTKARLRDARGVMSIENLIRDGRLALRQMAASPGFTAVAVATLGIGIGACAAMFSIVNTALLKPLPFEDPDALVWIQNYRSQGLSAQTTRVDNFLEWRQQSESFESMGAYFAFSDYATIMLSDETGGGTQRVKAMGITEGFLETLGVAPMLGRLFTEKEANAPLDVSAGPEVALLDYRFWQGRFGGDPGVVGRVVTLNGAPSEIVGVMPESFDFDSVFTPGAEVEMLTPFPLIEATANWGNTLAVVGRLQEGATLEEGLAELRVISDRIRTENANTNRFHHEANAQSLNERARGAYRTAFVVLAGAVVCLLGIACVNLSSLLVARANGRRHEFAMRSAVGATRWHLVRQNLIESMVLALAGCAVGVPLAYAAVAWVADLQAFSIPLLQGVSMDATSLVFVAAITCAVGLACGILPATQISGKALSGSLAESGQRGSETRRAGLLRRGLVATEIALACLLLVEAGLLIRSFQKLMEVDLGFDAQSAIAWRIDGGRNFDTQSDRSEYFNTVVEQVRSLPGVVSVGLTDTLPLGRNRSWGIQAKGDDGQPGPGAAAFPRIVTDGYAEAMGIELRAGRFISRFDTEDTQRVIVINQKLAQRFWPNEDAVGKILLGSGTELQVVGVVDNVRHGSLDQGAGNEMYLSMRQIGDYSSVEMVVRSRMPVELLAREVRRTLQDFDSTIPTEDFRSLQSIVEHSVAPRRLIMRALVGFSAVALGLAAIGLYGVIAYAVGQRSKEIGIRVAVGASKASVMGIIAGEGLVVTLAGVTIGLVCALALSRFLGSMLYGVGAADPLVFATNAAIVACIALLATALPARRALAVDPIQALRAD